MFSIDKFFKKEHPVLIEAMPADEKMMKNTNVFVPVDNFNSGGGDLDYSIRQRKRK